MSGRWPEREACQEKQFKEAGLQPDGSFIGQIIWQTEGPGGKRDYWPPKSGQRVGAGHWNLFVVESVTGFWRIDGSERRTYYYQATGRLVPRKNKDDTLAPMYRSC
jgi:hypothetical protein